jgi:hypothetical protein
MDMVHGDIRSGVMALRKRIKARTQQARANGGAAMGDKPATESLNLTERALRGRTG